MGNPFQSVIDELNDRKARIAALEAENAKLREREADRLRARPLSDWHEDVGDALWWSFPIEEAPYVGGPNDSDWPGYHTHWTPLRAEDCPANPSALIQGGPDAG